MNTQKTPMQAIPRIEYLRVKNYRALRDLELKGLMPLTVFLGPNGSGKSTVFDVFAFLAECFTSGLRRAWGKRGRASCGCCTVTIRILPRPGVPWIWKGWRNS